ncbi:MAG: (2Fe-2S)-binding protein [Alphaproteobacteria bacterium]|nr:(2Fe-2S)-binding protein [Alphaproteobacteria bacterium]
MIRARLRSALGKAGVWTVGLKSVYSYTGKLFGTWVLPVSDQSFLRVDAGVVREAPFKFTLDGTEFTAYPGETIAAALLAAGIRQLRRTEKQEQPRGIFCGMGVCFDCLVTVDGRMHLRACMTIALPGMKVTTQNEAEWRRSRR